MCKTRFENIKFIKNLLNIIKNKYQNVLKEKTGYEIVFYLEVK